MNRQKRSTNRNPKVILWPCDCYNDRHISNRGPKTFLSGKPINGDILLKQQCKSRNVSQGWKYKTHKREYIIDLIKLKFAHKSIIEYLYHTCKI